MRTPIDHAKLSAIEFGGDFTDYIQIHILMDSPSRACNHVLARSIFYTNSGAMYVAMIIGQIMPDHVDTYKVACAHIKRELGFIPTSDDWFKDLPNQLPGSIETKNPEYIKKKMEDSIRADKVKKQLEELYPKKSVDWNDLYPEVVTLPKYWPVIPTHNPVPGYTPRTIFEPTLERKVPENIALNNMV